MADPVDDIADAGLGVLAGSGHAGAAVASGISGGVAGAVAGTEAAPYIATGVGVIAGSTATGGAVGAAAGPIGAAIGLMVALVAAVLSQFKDPDPATARQLLAAWRASPFLYHVYLLGFGESHRGVTTDSRVKSVEVIRKIAGEEGPTLLTSPTYVARLAASRYEVDLATQHAADMVAGRMPHQAARIYVAGDAVVATPGEARNLLAQYRAAPGLVRVLEAAGTTFPGGVRQWFLGLRALAGELAGSVVPPDPILDPLYDAPPLPGQFVAPEAAADLAARTGGHSPELLGALEVFQAAGGVLPPVAQHTLVEGLRVLGGDAVGWGIFAAAGVLVAALGAAAYAVHRKGKHALNALAAARLVDPGAAAYRRVLAEGVHDGALRYLRAGMRPMTPFHRAFTDARYRHDLSATDLAESGRYFGAQVLPIRLSVDADGAVELADGRHLYTAAKAAGARGILADVVLYDGDGQVRRERRAKVRLL